MHILALAILLAVPSGTWYEHYDRALRLITEGQGATARDELQAALALRSRLGQQPLLSLSGISSYLNPCSLELRRLRLEAQAPEHVVTQRLCGITQ